MLGFMFKNVKIIIKSNVNNIIAFWQVFNVDSWLISVIELLFKYYNFQVLNSNVSIFLYNLN